MSFLFFLLLLVVVLAAAGSVLAGIAALLWYALVGLLIGAFARVLVRDTSGVGLFTTILAGIAGSIGGGLLAEALDLGGFVQLIVAVLVAAIVIAVFRPGAPRRIG